eukprot:TRINITY_DN950_c1_g1_i2.p1 TRINITY_DN950_c1_g1~~TRINITY_DN950_c1_g1_i2.p1  ORF type:complete len:226 (+),score=61.61 TRINITY_DN950_c1_g1_i2:415-1092(+)
MVPMQQQVLVQNMQPMQQGGQQQGAFQVFRGYSRDEQQQQHVQQQPQFVQQHHQQMVPIQQMVPQAMQQEGLNVLLKYSPAPQGVSNDDHEQRKQLQIISDRAPIMKAALGKAYSMNLSENGYEFTLNNRNNAVFVLDKLLEGNALAQALSEAERQPDINKGGLYGLLSDETIFWSAIQSWHTKKTAFSPKWDELLQRASGDDLDCPFGMFCKIAHCTFKHAHQN